VPFHQLLLGFGFKIVNLGFIPLDNL
jgi:hypothetical protein